MDFCIGTPVFWLVGFGLMFGAGNGFIGKIGGIATEAHYGSGMLPDGVPFWGILNLPDSNSVQHPQQLFPVQWQNVPSSFPIVYTAL